MGAREKDREKGRGGGGERVKERNVRICHRVFIIERTPCLTTLEAVCVSLC